MRTVLYSLAFLSVALMALPARAQSTKVPVDLEHMAECMLEVLKTVPGVSEPRLGTDTSNGWLHSFLEYRASEGSQWIQPTRFDAKKSDDGHYYFQTLLPGLGKIDTHVTEMVIQKWKWS